MIGLDVSNLIEQRAGAWTRQAGDLATIYFSSRSQSRGRRKSA
jgi:hypothetical protein